MWKAEDHNAIVSQNVGLSISHNTQQFASLRRYTVVVHTYSMAAVTIADIMASLSPRVYTTPLRLFDATSYMLYAFYVC